MDEQMVIGGADGPTSIFFPSADGKLSLGQKLQKRRFERKKKRVEKKIKAGTHSISEVCEVLQKTYGLVELSRDTEEYKTRYEEFRSGLIQERAPELLGKYRKMPVLVSHSEREVRKFLKKMEQREQAARKVPAELFDINLRIFKMNFSGKKAESAESGSDAEIFFEIEEKFGLIGGGAYGSKRVIRLFQWINSNIHRYYGVTEEDIAEKTERYQELVRAMMELPRSLYYVTGDNMK